MSWRAAYRGILADAFLDGDLLENRNTQWLGIAERMARRDNLLIATHETVAVGFIAGWTSVMLGCEDGYGLFIDNLHVRPELRGNKYGEQLFRALATNATANAKTSAYLWLLDGNAPAHRFYHRLGGRDGGHRMIELGGRTVSETRIVWEDFGIVAA